MQTTWNECAHTYYKAMSSSSKFVFFLCRVCCQQLSHICLVPFFLLLSSTDFGLFSSSFLNTFTSSCPLWKVLKIVTSFYFPFHNIFDPSSVFMFSRFLSFISVRHLDRLVMFFLTIPKMSVFLSVCLSDWKAQLWAGLGVYVHVLYKLYQEICHL